MISIFFLLILIPLIFGIPILVGVYVYRDANKRGMNAILWLLIAILTPSLLGLIIYLLVRNNYSDLKCPRCDTRVEESFVMCPNCRTKLRPTCDICSATVQTTWKVCPHCGTELPEYSGDVATPVRTKDRTLGKILIAILIIPVALIILLLLAFSGLRAYNQVGYQTSSLVTMTMSEFMENRQEAEVAMYRDWFETCSSTINEQPYHIFVYEADTPNGTYEYQYLIYIPGACGYQDFSYDVETKGFFSKQDYMALDIICDEKAKGEQQLFIFTYEGNVKPPQNFLITYNGEEYEIKPNSHTNQQFLPDMTKKPGAADVY